MGVMGQREVEQCPRSLWSALAEQRAGGTLNPPPHGGPLQPVPSDLQIPLMLFAGGNGGRAETFQTKGCKPGARECAPGTASHLELCCGWTYGTVYTGLGR